MKAKPRVQLERLGVWGGGALGSAGRGRSSRQVRGVGGRSARFWSLANLPSGGECV